MKGSIRGLLAALFTAVTSSLCVSIAADGDAVVTQERPAIRTTHVVSLTNGAVIHGTFLEETDGRVTLALQPYGTMTVPRNRIAGIEVEPGTLAVSPLPRTPRAPDRKEEHETPPEKVDPDARQAAIQERLTPPAVPADKQKEIDYWLYHLTREKQQWRVRAERYLKTFGSVVVGPVLPYTRYPDPQWSVRVAALRILGEVGHPAGVPALWRSLQDREPIVRHVAQVNLVNLFGKKVLFKANAGIRARRMAVRRWRKFLEGKGLLLEQEGSPR